MTDVSVIGAGVIGLTTAIRLAEAGFTVRIIAEHFSPNTTSDGAAAIWEPVFVEPKDKVLAWAGDTLSVLQGQACQSEAGIFPVTVNRLNMLETPDWSALLESWRETMTIPAGVEADCFRYRTLVTDMGLYLPFLYRLAESKGIRFERKECVLANLRPEQPTIFCVGSGARALLRDAAATKARGVVLIFNERLTHDAWLDASRPECLTYIIPRLSQTIVGGTYEPGELGTDIPATLVTAIKERAAAILPALNNNAFKVWAGFRPGRSSVRLEQDAGRPQWFYNYGHGGAGVTLSWGCAGEIARLVSASTVLQTLHTR